MPNTLDLIKKTGVTFNRYYASYPLCCPSRATLLSGRYAHSHGVISNDAPRGGWPGYQEKAIYEHNLGVWLQTAGYRTIHVGKFLNDYGGATRTTRERGAAGLGQLADGGERQLRPPLLRLPAQRQRPPRRPLRGPRLRPDQRQGRPRLPGHTAAGRTPATTSWTDDATGRCSRSSGSAPGRPFYLQLDYNAPHGDPRPPIGPEPAARHYDTAVDTPLPKPPELQRGQRLRQAELHPRRRQLPRPDRDPPDQDRVPEEPRVAALGRRRSRQRWSTRCAAAASSPNTYVLFLSDNGFFFGEHRLERSKFLPYEPAIHMPLLIRGPGIQARSRIGELVANIDLAPTILELAGRGPTAASTGARWSRSGRDNSLRTRRPILLESFINATDIDGDGVPDSVPRRGGASASIAAPVENYLGVRLGPYKYVEYETGDRELYDLVKDPYELQQPGHRTPATTACRRSCGARSSASRAASDRDCRFTDQARCRGRACRRRPGRADPSLKRGGGGVSCRRAGSGPRRARRDRRRSGCAPACSSPGGTTAP